jgi:hypothetical protein
VVGSPQSVRWSGESRIARKALQAPEGAATRDGANIERTADRRFDHRRMVEEALLRIELSPDVDEVRGFDPGNVC